MTLLVSLMATVSAVSFSLGASRMAVISRQTGVVESNLLAEPWKSLVIGCVVGIAAMLWEKFVLRQERDYCADFYVASGQRRWESILESRNLWTWMPYLLGMLFAWGTAWFMKISTLPALCGPSIMFFLIYPETHAIYKLALDKQSSAPEKAPILEAV